MEKRQLLAACGGLLIVGTLAGCGGSGPAAKVGSASSNPVDVIDSPVHLTIAAQLSDELYKQFIAEPVAKKFPNVTLEQIKSDGNGTAAPGAIAKLISAGTIPDIVLTLPGWYGQEKLQDLFSDLTPLIKKYNFDTNRYLPGIMETVKSYSPEGKIDFLPESMTTLITLYNKDIFDKFGVPYPKDGMTWEDTFELAKKLSRNDNGMTYRGMDVIRDFNVNNTQLSLPFVDGKTMKSAVNSDGWKQYFNLMSNMYGIAGNRPDKKDLGNFASFAKDQKVAMYVGRLENITQLVADNANFNWDMVTMPVFKDLPGTGTQVNTPFFAITPSSTNKDAAFKVIAYLLSDPVQTANNKDGRLTVLKDESIRKQYGSNSKQLAGKHMEAVLALKPAKPRPFTIYDNFAVARLGAALTDVVTSNKDINTALRDADDLTNKDIEANKK